MKELKMNIEDCLSCPLKRLGDKRFFYCSHIDSPDDHLIVDSNAFDDLDGFMPDWCPLPNSPLPNKRLKWNDVKDSDRSSIQDSYLRGLNITYEILENAKHVDEVPNGYILYRWSENLKMDFGIIGEEDNSIGIVCGMGAFCAIGAPQSAVKQTIEEVKDLAERDLQQLMEKNNENN